MMVAAVTQYLILDSTILGKSLDLLRITLRGNETLSAQCLKNGRAQRSRNIVTRSDVGVRTNR